MLPLRLAEILSLPLESLAALKILKRSLDARRRRPPFFVYVIEVAVPDDAPLPVVAGAEVTIEKVTHGESVLPSALPLASGQPVTKFAVLSERKMPKVIVVGGGPAGLFAALTLAEKGIPPLLLERGKQVSGRIKDVSAFWKEGDLDPESNVLFGEGGAGTFSDGKLTSRARNPLTGRVKEILVSLGAPADILVDAKPHIGTDLLRRVVVNFRQKLLDLGCEMRFGTRVSDFLLSADRVAAVLVNDREEIPCDAVLLAIGQNADDTYRVLQARAVHMAAKPFALGLRVEHPQSLINEIQYGSWQNHPDLPPAEYFLTTRVTDPERSVYTFCMCPGGRVIGCSSEPGGVITNGMSFADRGGAYGNSAVVVNVKPEDFSGTSSDPLQGLVFRRQWETRAFVLGGKNYHAPAQRLTDFLQDREGDRLPPVTYRPGVQPAPLNKVLPAFAAAALRKGLCQFERQMPGFVTAEATLIGVETRTSAPLRILRGATGQSVNTARLFPCGEGAGYAGGIISSALDGMKAAENVVQYLNTESGHR